jgi:NAD(P)-dependent dehydrogenase (short-subunit alcohol dehydrogenase family)
LAQLAGKRMLVTGAARGIAAAGVRAFVREGAAVAALDVLDEPAREVAREASAEGPGRAFFLRCDVSKRDEVHAAVAAATAELGGLDALVHAAAIHHSAQPEELAEEQWDETIDINLKGTFLVNQAVFPYLRDGGGGRIVNFASAAGLIPHVNSAHYAAAKGGVLAWTRTIAHIWGRYGITANCVNPVMDTPMAQTSRAERSPEERAAYEQAMARQIPLGGRFGDPERDIAPLLVFLVGDGARFMTAQIIAVDGGSTPLR